MRLHALLFLLPLAISVPDTNAPARSRHHKSACSATPSHNTSSTGIGPEAGTGAINVGSSGFEYGKTKIRGVNLGGVRLPILCDLELC